VTVGVEVGEGVGVTVGEVGVVGPEGNLLLHPQMVKKVPKMITSIIFIFFFLTLEKTNFIKYTT